MLTTKLVPDGNSTAIRLPKALLLLSGLSDVVQMEAKPGQIVLRSAANPRAGWRQQIRQELEAHGPPATTDKYGDLAAEADATLADGLNKLGKF